MNGKRTPSSASRSAMLVWVKAPGLKIRKRDAAVRRRVHARDELMLGVALEGREFMARLGAHSCRRRFSIAASVSVP